MTGPEAFAITATLATASAVVGWLIARWLRTHAHRYADEAGLERRTHAWVPVVSALVLPLLALGGWRTHGWSLALVTWTLGAVLLTMAAIDIDVRRLPDRFTKPLVPASVLGTGLVALVTGSGGDWVRGVLGGVVLGVVYLVLALLGRGTGLGLGDVKLAPSLGVLLAFHSWAAVVLASVLAFVSAGVFGLVLIGLRRADRRSTLAFGPHMIGSAVLVLAAPGLGWVLGLSSTG
ncbi:MAG TPA: A24 family peptidase [Ornithinibacter sp.]|nr:prepilin peptidase [Dermatophilaceae bacterium]MBU9943660.1 A24 family peptidase [Dermatophilaceae bacterium]HQV82484.1 A24 family peptidase [Ornithinibacter sp.]HQX87240.1 A24 family peptidase [Ornithinibacter sp.]HQZ09573.1 A24 family peptidase [Ornithinibacter sp.]